MIIGNNFKILAGGQNTHVGHATRQKGHRSYINTMNKNCELTYMKNAQDLSFFNDIFRFKFDQ